MAYDVPQLLGMSQNELDELFKKSPTGEIPNGEGKGTAIVAPGTTYTQDLAQFISYLHMARESFRCQERRTEKQDSALWDLTRSSPRFIRERVGWMARNA